MINKQGLLMIIAQAERSSLLPGEIMILREAVDLLDDLSSMVDKIISGYDHARGYDHETTQELKIIEQGGSRHHDAKPADDDHCGNRP